MSTIDTMATLGRARGGGMSGMGTGGIATLCGLASTIIIIVYHIKHQPSNNHVIFSTVGYFVFLMSLSWGGMFAGFYLDWVIMVIGLILVILGMVIHIKDQGMAGADLHGYLGIAAVVCYALAFIVGILLFFLASGLQFILIAYYLNFVLTRAALTLGGVALITGLLKDNYRSWAPDWLFYVHIVLVIIFTLCMFIAFLLALF